MAQSSSVSSAAQEIESQEHSEPAITSKNLTNVDEYLLSRLRQQVEYYFSPQNLSKDSYLRSLLVYSQNSAGAAPLQNIASFPMVRKLCSGNKMLESTNTITELIRKALSSSNVVSVSADGEWINILQQPQMIPMHHHVINKVPQHYHINSSPPPVHPQKAEVAFSNMDPNDLGINSTFKERSTIILRDVSEDFDAEKVVQAFTTESVTPKGARSDLGMTWYVYFESESEALEALSVSKNRLIDNKPIKARVKSETSISGKQPSRSSSPSSSNPPLQEGVAVGGFPPYIETASKGSQSIGKTSNDERIKIGAQQLNVFPQNAPHNYVHYTPMMETHGFTTQTHPFYQHHYGIPMQGTHGNPGHLPPFLYATHMPPYMHHGNPPHFPLHHHGNPYIINNLPTVEVSANSNFQPREFNRRGDNRHAYMPQRSYQGGPFIGKTNTGVEGGRLDDQNLSNSNNSNQRGLNDIDRNAYFRQNPNSKNVPVGSHQSQNLVGKDNHKRNKGGGYSRPSNPKNDGYSNMNFIETKVRSGNLSMVRPKNKSKKNRKKESFSGSGSYAMNNDNDVNNPKPPSQEEIILNAFNFPELSIEGKMEESPITNEGAGSNVANSNKLTGYAAALLQKSVKRTTEPNGDGH